MMDPVLIGEGKANAVYDVGGRALRVSKRGVSANDVAANWARWRARPGLAAYMGTVEVVQHPQLGEAMAMVRHGSGAGVQLLVEFKPKWLLQSPDAPDRARSCRTCAIGAMRGKPATWCPLRLVASTDLTPVLQSMGAAEPQQCASFLSQCDLLARLTDAQRGAPSTLAISSNSAELSQLLEAMTARDCTVILELAGGAVRGWLVDLDAKRPDKLSEWQRIEYDLQPWYMRENPVCLLSDKH